MFKSARQVYTRRIAPCLPQALPAESSRQALLRANAATAAGAAARAQLHSDTRSARHGSSGGQGRDGMAEAGSGSAGRGRGISSGSASSAALAMAEHDRHPNQDRHQHQGSSRYGLSDEGKGRQLNPRPPDHHLSSQTTTTGPSTTDNDDARDPNGLTLPPTKKTPEWLDSWIQSYDLDSLPPSPLPPLETFRGLLPTQPILALLTLSQFSQTDISKMETREIRGLINQSLKVLHKNHSLLNRLDLAKAAKALRVLRAILYALPSQRSHPDAYSGKYLQGKVLHRFLLLCLRLNAPRLASMVLQERLREQIANDSAGPDTEFTPIPFDSIAKDLSAMRQWQMIVDIFSPSSFPHRYYTPHIIATYMQAHFGIHQGSKVPRIFELYDILRLPPTAEAFNHLIQAFLEVGDLPMARSIVQEVKISGVADYAQQQLAILRGYGALGMDAGLEKRVLSDIERLQLPLENRLLNQLIKLRLDADDYRGAELLLARFDLSSWGRGKTGNVQPSDHTARLVFRLSALTRDVEKLSQAWKQLKENEKVGDETIYTLLNAMVACGLLDKAAGMLGVPPNTKSASAADFTEHDWTLPKGVKPGIKSLNYLLGELCRHRGIKGLEQGLRLIHTVDVKPDNLTLKTMVDAIRSAIHHTPQDLAQLIDRIVNATGLEPSQSLLDSVLADAVVAGARAHDRGQLPTELEESASESTQAPTAGLALSSSLSTALQDMLSTLKTADSRSTSRTLANRLRFDSMTSSTISGIPSARLVWNSLIARGFKPDDRHFTALMRGYADAGHMHQAQDLLVLAEQVAVQPTIPMLFTLMVGWGKIGRAKMARQAYERIKLISPFAKPSLGVVTAMVQALLESREWSEAAELCYTDLSGLNVPLDRKALIVTAQALRHARDFRGALELIGKHGKSLDPVSRKVVKGIRNYQRKVLGLNIPSIASGEEIGEMTQRDLWMDAKKRARAQEASELLAIANRLLRYDDWARPKHLRRWTKLDDKLGKRLQNAFIGPGTKSEVIDELSGMEQGQGQGRGRTRGTSAVKATTAPAGAGQGEEHAVGRSAANMRRRRRRFLSMVEVRMERRRMIKEAKREAGEGAGAGAERDAEGVVESGSPSKE